MATFRFKCAHLNELFSEEFAKEYHNGQESKDNLRHHWLDELEVKQVKSVAINDNGTYMIQGSRSHDGDFSIPINSMRLITLTLKEGGEVNFAISNQLIHSFQIKEKDWGTETTVELKDHEPFVNPIVGIYIANRDFPAELMSHDKD